MSSTAEEVLKDAWDAEIRRRVEELDSGAVERIPWTEVRKRLFRGFERERGMAKIKPRTIQGRWAAGYALDLHSTSSIFLGYNGFGHPEYDTKRTEIGELLYRLKYKTDETALTEIAATIEEFIRSWALNFR